ncbi:hypothetical protein EH165_04455 [Nakamurella antarctica]|uniref:Uncharacterized protein n=1 Tax=Nakamurella antarctica TaxID=1902245 RepID=A0A3G8ZJS8_9ACTN|nr:hypothetical protein [Nakamurella antarctica]AZI57523.1 hypothetical protein EH165_04455 [Nakamurella antarctica]
MDEPRRLLDPSVGDWINARLVRGESSMGSRVRSVIPTGFQRVVRDGNGRSGNVDPDEGSVPVGTLTAILDHCLCDGNVVQGVWLGFGTWTYRWNGEPVLPGWGGREYRLFATAKAAITTWPGMSPSWPQSANLIWPADNSWCIATEIDWDSTLVAGSTDMTDAILADVRLESFVVEYEDDLSWCGNILNPRPDWLARQCPPD